jgi:hypothetical protein
MLAWVTAALICVAFGLMAMHFPFALRSGDAGLWAALQSLLTGADYSVGPGSAHEMYPVYQRALTAMSSHTALGGLALTLGVSQFIPALRRRHPALHRAAGLLVILAVTASMIGALTYLNTTPLAEIYASPSFGLALWALSLAALAYLSLALWSLRRRDFRSHMGFMALMMSTLLTAPLLRVEWAAFGALLAWDMRTVNQGVTPFLGLATVLLMMLWMHFVGTHDLPARPRSAIRARWVVAASGAAGAVLVHEGVLAPLGVDLLRGWRAPGERFPLQGLLWGLSALLLLVRLPVDLPRVQAGGKPRAATTALAVVNAVGALVLGGYWPDTDIDGIGLTLFWPSFGLISLCLIIAGQVSARRDAPWSLCWLLLTLTPASWPALFMVAWLAGQSYTIGLWLACTIGLSASAAIALMLAYSVRLPFPSRVR